MGIEFYGLNSRKPHAKFAGSPSIVSLDLEDPDRVDLNNANGAALLGLLGLRTDGELTGSCPILAAQAAVARAKRSFAARAPKYTTPVTRPVVKPWRAPDGTVVLNPLAGLDIRSGLDDAGLRARLDRLERLIGRLAALGATDLAWA